MSNLTIAVGRAPDGLYLHLRGRTTQRVCSTAERLVDMYLATNPPRPDVTLDLDGAAWIDSTFGGWMISVFRRTSRSRGRVVLANAAPRCIESLQRMAIDKLFTFRAAAAPADVAEIACPTDDRVDDATLALMAEAHERLAELSQENERTFGPIAALLRHQLAARSGVKPR